MRRLSDLISIDLPENIFKITTVLIIIMFMVLVVISVSPLDKISEIGLWDETRILENGMNWSFDSMFVYESSPLYSFSYFLLSRFIEDPINVYYLNHILLLAGLMISVFYVLFKISGSLLWPVTVTLSFVYFKFYKIWPRVNFLTSIILILGFFTIYKTKDRFLKINLSLVLSYILIFIRPEFYVSFYLFFFLSIILFISQLLKERKTGDFGLKNFLLKKRTGIVLFFIVVCLLAVFVLPAPNDSRRSFTAFGQHYSVNIHRVEGHSTDPWTSWETVVKRDFKDSKGVVGAFFVNPGAFFSHIGRNISEFVLMNKNIFLKRYGYSILLFMAILFFLIRYFFKIKKKEIPGIFAGKDIYDYYLLLIFMFPVVLSMFLIYPRIHYFLLFWTMLILMLTIFLFGYKIRRPKLFDHVFTIVLITGLLIFPMTITSGSYDNNLSIIRSLREFEKSRQMGSVLELEMGWSTYLKTVKKPPLRILNASESWYKRNIDTIIVSMRLKNNIEGKPLMNILKVPGKYGFRKHFLKNNFYLLLNIKND